MNRLKSIYITLMFSILLFTHLSAQNLKIVGNCFLLEGQPFDMWGVRVASASQTEKETQSLISNLDDYKANGINSISVFLQGSSGGYSDPFLNNGKDIDEHHFKRISRIIEACAEKDIVVIVGIFYQRAISDKKINKLPNEKAIQNAVITVTKKLSLYKNIIINIANEHNSTIYKSFEPFNFNDPENIVKLCKLVKEIDPNRLVGGGGYNDESNVIIGKSGYVDVLLFDTFSEDIESGHHSGWHHDFFRLRGVPDKPLVNVEIFGGWTRKSVPQGVYSPEDKDIHYIEIYEAIKKPGLYVHFHSNPWFQGAAQGFENKYDLGGRGVADSPGVKWYFEKIKNNN